MGVRDLLAGVVLLLCAAGAVAQPAFRSASSLGSDGNIQYVASGNPAAANGCTTVSPTTPAGLGGDLLVAVVASGDSPNLAPSAGWNTLLASNPVANLTSRIYWRFADGSANDGLTVTKTNAGSGCNVMIGRMARFRGVDPVNPFDSGEPIPGANCTAGGARVKCSYQSAASVTTGGETTVTANAMLLFAVMITDNNATNAGGLGFTESFDSGTGLGNDAQVALSYRQETTAGVKGPFTIAKGGGADPNHGVLFALRPSATTLTVATPAGTQLGDVMVAAVAVRPSTVTITAPAGWTALAPTVQVAGNSSRQQFFYRTATVGEPVSHTWTLSASHTGAAAGMAAYYGADPATPLDVFGGNATPVGGDSNVQHRAQGIVTTVPSTTVITAHSFSSAETWTPPGGMTERVDVASLPTPNGAGISLEMNDSAQLAAGATGDRVATAAGNGDTGVAQILALRPAPFYFDIQAGQYNLRCGAFPAEISIVVRDTATGAVIPGFANLVNLSTSAGVGNWSVVAANGALNNGAANDGAATYQFVAGDSGAIVLGLAVTSLSSLTVGVQDSVTGVTSAGPTINFVSDGYVIVPDPIQIAGRPQVITVERRVAPGCGLAGGAGHNGNNAEKIWLTLDASHPGAAALPGATGVTIVNPLPTAEPGANNITLAFAGGVATFQLTSADVGKYRINIRDTNTARRGTSPAITTRPFALAFPGIQHGSDENSAVLAAAGDDFAATLGAYLWQAGDDNNVAGGDGVPDAPNTNVTDNGLAPRFAWDTLLAAGAALPSPGATGTLTRAGGTPLVPLAGFAGGAAPLNDLRYSEVGNAVITATVSNYLDTPGATVTGHSGLDGAASAYVGRFRPKHFALSSGTLMNRSALACAPASTFSYMNEGLQLGFTLTAQNTQNQTTANYHGAYAKLGLTTFANWNIGARSGTTDLTARVDTAVAPTGSWVNGVAANVAITTGIRRATPDDPDGPYPGLAFGIAPVDPDTTAMDVLDLDVDNNAATDHKSVGGATEARFGRLRLQNALGSERVTLPVRMEAQYWNGSAFATNGDDDCTALPRSAIALDFTGSTLAACQTALTQATVTFADGAAVPTLAAPNPNRGSVLLRANLSAAAGNYCAAVGGAFDPATSASMPYLLGRWDDGANPDADANTSYDDEPAARATFGLYGSQPNNFIYFREVF